MFKLKHQGVLMKMSSRFGQAEENVDSSIMTVWSSSMIFFVLLHSKTNYIYFVTFVIRSVNQKVTVTYPVLSM